MTSLWRNRLTRLSVLLMCFTGAASELRADPLEFEGTFFLIDPSPNRLDLFSNPGSVLEARQILGDFGYLFGAFVSHSGGESFTDTIRFTYQEQGTAPVVWEQTFTTGTDPITLGFPPHFFAITRTGLPVPTTLRVELLNSAPDFVIPGGPQQGQLVDSFTYSFNTVAPVPEPSTLVLVLSGGIAALARRRRLFRPSGRNRTP